MFAVWVSLAVVAVLAAVAVLVVTINNRPAAEAVVPESISIGEGADTVDVWFDFYCPHCQVFEDQYGPTIEELIDSGDITLNLHPVALSGLNAASGTQFSERSGGALHCVAEAAPEATLDFFQQLFALNPSGAGLTDGDLAALASQTGADAASDCIADGMYRPFVIDQAAELPTDPATEGAGTPTLLVNGEYIAITGSPQADILERIG
ncbi:DsbA family protein [uncultured Microbacterium sp.]|uniref:DsbA family protein n=1 Tax=uncultured Microbacterium sp. TaxID=191216 RepID=UPI0026368E47|nr:thioredoxin domain-containing protein [uncultured Microbacterium sp.]